jgi:hypothetical protein
MISKEFIEHTYDGVKYYEYNGVYFYRDKNLFSDEKFMELMRQGSEYVNNRPIYVFRAYGDGQIICEYAARCDCELKKQIDDMTIMYREADIDFNNRDIYGFIEQCWSEKQNHNVVCFMSGGLDGYDVESDLTLRVFFERCGHELGEPWHKGKRAVYEK